MVGKKVWDKESAEMNSSSRESDVASETMTDKRVGSPAQAAPDAIDAIIRVFVGKLVKARKDLAFYPKGNPAVQTAMQQCERSQSEAIGSHGTLELVISRDQFFVDDRPLFAADSPERRFAAELFTLGVRRTRFTGEARASDFEELVELLQEARDNPVSLKAALTGLGTRSIRGIELEQIPDLQVVDESSPVEEIDLVLGRIEDDYARGNAAVVNDLYVRILPGTLEPGQLKKLMENPVRVREALGRLARAREGTRAGAVATEVATDVFRNITNAIGSVPLKEQSGLYRTAAELLLNTAEPLRTRLLMEKTLPHVTSDNHEGALIRSLTDGELVELLTTHVPLHEGALEAVSNSFRNLGLSLSRRESILNLIEDGAKAGGPRSRQYSLLFDGLNRAAGVDSAAEDSRAALDKELNNLITSAKCLQLTPEEASDLEKSVKSAGVQPEVENIPAVLNLLHLEKDVQWYRSVLDVLEALRKEALKEGRLDAAFKVVEGYAFEKQRGLSTGKWELVENALERATGEETITVLAEMSLCFEKNSPEYSLIVDYLRTVPDRAYHILLERLEEESSKSLRLAIRGFLIALGRVDTASLSSRVLHKQWFVARNVASILGEIGGESAVEILATALRHEEPRVRREALNALGKIATESAARVIAGALEDSNNDVALCAARWLTTLVDVAPLDRLFFVVESGRFRRTDPETVLSAVQAIARKDSVNTTGFLRRVARKRFRSFFGSGRRIAACAARVLREKGTGSRDENGD